MAGYWLPSLCCAYSCGCVLSPVGILPGALASGVWQWLPAHSRAGTHSHGSHGWRLALPVWRVLSRWLDCMTGHPPARGECLPRGLRLALSRLPALLAHSLPGWLDYSPRVLPRGSPLDCSPGGCHSPGGWIAWRGAPRRVACAHGWRLAAPWFRLAVAGGSFPRHSWRGMAPRFPWRALPWRALPWLPALHGSRALSMVVVLQALPVVLPADMVGVALSPRRGSRLVCAPRIAGAGALMAPRLLDCSRRGSPRLPVACANTPPAWISRYGACAPRCVVLPVVPRGAHAGRCFVSRRGALSCAGACDNRFPWLPVYSRGVVLMSPGVLPRLTHARACAVPRRAVWRVLFPACVAGAHGAGACVVTAPRSRCGLCLQRLPGACGRLSRFTPGACMAWRALPGVAHALPRVRVARLPALPSHSPVCSLSRL